MKAAVIEKSDLVLVSMGEGQEHHESQYYQPSNDHYWKHKQDRKSVV